MKDILNSTHLPKEIVIVDGGSTDNTVERLHDFQKECQRKNVKLRVEMKPGVNIAQGRNIAISMVENEVIAVTDAGCRLEPDWLYRITLPILEDRADMVGGFYIPVAHTRFQRVLSEITVAPSPPSGFLPSSRSIAFTKTLWEKVGGYPEWLMWGEDTLFDQYCLKAGARYVIEPSAKVLWELRSDCKQAIKQFYCYALGDGQALRLAKSHVIVQVVYWGSIGLILMGYILHAFALMIFFHFGMLVKRRGFAIENMMRACLLLAGIQTARFYGYTRGVIWRVTNRKRT